MNFKFSSSPETIEKAKEIFKLVNSLPNGSRLAICQTIFSYLYMDFPKDERTNFLMFFANSILEWQKIMEGEKGVSNDDFNTNNSEDFPR